jgi:predicted nucleotidyltransferase
MAWMAIVRKKRSRRWGGSWMFCNKKPESDLDKIAKAVSAVEGVIAAILFGSRAKGNADEYSDYDVLVIFQSDGAREKNWDELYERVSKTGLFAQVSARSLKEIRERTEPTFLQEVLKHGRVIFSRYPFEVPAAISGRPMRIVTYNLRNLTHADKQKLCYRLFGKRTKRHSYEGEVAKLGGIRLGDGCIMVPEEKYAEISELLKAYNVKHDALITYVIG